MNFYLLDTNIFDSIVKNSIGLNNFVGRRIAVTHIQVDELSNTADELHRSKILAAFETIESEKIPTEGAIWDVSSWDQAKFDADDGSYERLMAAIQECDGKSKRNKTIVNQSRDALLAVTAIKKNMVLVTNDGCLMKAVLANAGKATSLNQFLES